MDITPYVDGLRRDLTAAAAAGGSEVEAAAERLALALDPAVRMMLLEALSDAAGEISRDLGASIDVRLKGREPRFVVTAPPPPQPPAPPHPPGDAGGEVEDDEDAAVARITLRMPEGLKQRAEDLAAKRGQSLNTWLVAAARLAAHTGLDLDIDVGDKWVDTSVRRRRAGRGLSGWAK
jgi:hypothetical protein